MHISRVTSALGFKAGKTHFYSDFDGTFLPVKHASLHNTTTDNNMPAYCTKMNNFFSKRRLKIAEQIIIVIFFAVIIPMTISAFIINNVNQQSNRAQLRDAAVMVANIVSEEVDVFQHSIDNELTQIATTLEYYDSPEKWHWLPFRLLRCG